MAIHEEYSVLGIFGTRKENVANTAYYGLYALQHRGQESCGIAINDDGVFSSYKDLGLVGEVLSKDTLSSLSKGNMAVGHVRYGTAGGTTRSNTQSMEISHQRGKMVIVHNGNLSSSSELRDKLELSGAIFNITNDTETIAYVTTRERLKVSSIEGAVSKVMNSLRGTYSLALMSSTKLIAARDPHGFRLLCYGGIMDGRCVIASESCALSAIGVVLIRDVLPGEVVVFSKENVVSRKEHYNKEKRKTCIFEYTYFARPDSVIDTISASLSRCKADELLAENYPVDVDAMIGIPDSGMEAALGYANASKIPYGIGLIKDKYIGRTFISPGQDERLDQARIKLSPVKNVIEGRRVVLIDDPTVRGTTNRHIVKLFRDIGAEEVHIGVSAPSFLHPCYYDTNIDLEENLVACCHNTWEIEEIPGVDPLGYLPIERLGRLVEGAEYCAVCSNGEYSTNIPKDLRKDRFEGKLSEKICSGQGKEQSAFMTRIVDTDTA